MAKSKREKLELEAADLGLNPQDYESNADLKAAIEARKVETGAGNDGPKAVDSEVGNDKDAGERHVYKKGVGDERVAGKQPSDEVQYTEATPEKDKASEVKGDVSFETTKPVSFNINGKQYDGTQFSFESEEVAKARKDMLIEKHGASIIKTV